MKWTLALSVLSVFAHAETCDSNKGWTDLRSVAQALPHLACLDRQKEIASAPLCPEKGKLLTDAYPAMAVTISDDLGGARFVADFVLKTLHAQPDHPPQFFLNVKASTYDQVLTQVENLPGTAEQKQARRQALTRIQTDYVYNWQQDFEKPSFDPKTGRPTLRYVTGYDPGHDSKTNALFQSLAEQAKGCGIQTDAPLTAKPDPANGSAPNGANGGNLESLAGGAICVVGNDSFKSTSDWQQFSGAACGAGTAQVQAPTSWLSVGHTDEIFKAIPIPGRSAPCNFALLLASPRKATELMKANPTSPAFAAATSAGAASVEDYFDILKSDSLEFNFSDACRDYQMNVGEDLDDCPHMTNRQLLAQSQRSYGKFNQSLQAQLDNFHHALETQITKQIPGCQPPVIEVPDLFLGNPPKRIAQGDSLFPNPTNAVMMGSTLIFSDPINPTFKTYLQDQMKKLGVQTDFVDTLASHVHQGNLHCTTQVMRYCQPRP